MAAAAVEAALAALVALVAVGWYEIDAAAPALQSPSN